MDLAAQVIVSTRDIQGTGEGTGGSGGWAVGGLCQHKFHCGLDRGLRVEHVRTKITIGGKEN
jgi:hypothetical protein